jgi:hypothetical protein
LLFISVVIVCGVIIILFQNGMPCGFAALADMPFRNLLQK